MTIKGHCRLNKCQCAEAFSGLTLMNCANWTTAEADRLREELAAAKAEGEKLKAADAKGQGAGEGREP